MGDIANITLSKDLIEPIVRAQLHASIVAALGRSEDLVAGVVTTIMNAQVDSEGKPSNRDYGSRPLITWMAEKAVKEAALEAIKEWFSGNRDAIKKEVEHALKRNTKMMAEKFVMGMTDAAARTYNAHFDVSFKTQ